MHSHTSSWNISLCSAFANIEKSYFSIFYIGEALSVPRCLLSPCSCPSKGEIGTAQGTLPEIVESVIEMAGVEVERSRLFLVDLHAVENSRVA
jgi:hypothetical protein